ncbi:hypothetical protein OZ411_01415 [Bradyrhizobium sp. Arg237L]|uniref:hypothetical protein n=1 Tax=Bradyrhizobium sp. Arg237L TaxID=3003352 RepID=UPI00249EB803|nr:hypothetical protein [Bradyrhizobium sp. Arg237L]MDI4231472.1 hypothetical protein [Bradyrhizobium sp. Arg237L]
MPRDIYDHKEWTEMDIEDLTDAMNNGTPIEIAAEWLCRSGSIDDVERKARELKLPIRRENR